VANNNQLKIIQDEKESEKPWYKDGLKFSCTQCGKCCTGSPGYAWVTLEEIEEIAKFLKLEINEFTKNYLRKVDGRWALLEYTPNYDCCFLKENRCSIYNVRPKQCRTFPWWVENLQSKEAWDEAGRFCEGINKEDAPIHTAEEIEESL
jgi:uncharacterized protein